MPVSEKPKTYTAHGEEFDSKEDAERYDEYATAKDAFETTRKAFARIMWSRFKTADGEQFDLTARGDYWHVWELYKTMPRLKRVSFYVHQCRMDEYNEDEAVIYQNETVDPRTHETQGFEYRITELYRDERKARVALKAAQKRYIDQCTEEMNRE